MQVNIALIFQIPGEDRYFETPISQSEVKGFFRVSFHNFSPATLPKTKMDTQNDGLEKITPFKNGNVWYLC